MERDGRYYIKEKYLFIDDYAYTYNGIYTVVTEFDENVLSKSSLCGQTAKECIYCFLRDNGYFNLLDILEVQYKQHYGLNYLEELEQDYKDQEMYPCLTCKARGYLIRE